MQSQITTPIISDTSNIVFNEDIQTRAIVNQQNIITHKYSIDLGGTDIERRAQGGNVLKDWTLYWIGGTLMTSIEQDKVFQAKSKKEQCRLQQLKQELLNGCIYNN